MQFHIAAPLYNLQYTSCRGGAQDCVWQAEENAHIAVTDSLITKCQADAQEQSVQISISLSHNRLSSSVREILKIVCARLWRRLRPGWQSLMPGTSSCSRQRRQQRSDSTRSPATLMPRYIRILAAPVKRSTACNGSFCFDHHVEPGTCTKVYRNYSDAEQGCL